MRKIISISVLTTLLVAGLFLARQSKIEAAANPFSGFGGTYGSQSITLTNQATTIVGQSALFWILPGDSRYSTNSAATNAMAAPDIQVRQGQTVAFQLSTASSNTTSSAHSVVFVTSLDGITWDTATPYVLTFLPGTSPGAVSTNWNILGHIAPWYVTNASADSGAAHGYLTNFSLKYALPGY